MANRPCVLLLVLAGMRASVAAAQEKPPRTYGNLRVGATAEGYGGRAEICGEVSPIAPLSFEACGDGSQLMHTASAAAMMHVMAKLRLASWRMRAGWLEPRIGLGIAELEQGEDELGFNFRSAGLRGESTTGPEGTVALRALLPAWRQWEAVLELRASLAWLPHAPELARPMSRAQPSVGFSAGIGF